jgi:hypothetical protein
MQTYEGQYNESSGQRKQADKYEAVQQAALLDGMLAGCSQLRCHP